MSMTAAGLAFASVGSILAFTLGGPFSPHGFVETKLVAVIIGVVVAATWHNWRESPLCRPVVLYLGCMVPSIIVSIDLPTSLFGFVNAKSHVYSGGLLTTLLAAGGLLMAEQLEERKDAENVFRAIAAAGMLAALAAVGQRMGHDIFNFGPNAGRAIAFSGAHYDAGALFAVLLAFSPLTAAIPTWLYGAAIWATAARGAFLGGLVALVPVRHRVKAFALASLIGMVYACLPATNQSDRGRQGLWDMAAKSASFLGSGPATFPQVMARQKTAEWTAKYQPEDPNFFQAHAHNAILDTMVTKGFFGLLGLLTLLAVPELAGLWTVAMFNPISFEIVFVACVLAGLNRRLQGENL